MFQCRASIISFHSFFLLTISKQSSNKYATEPQHLFVPTNATVYNTVIILKKIIAALAACDVHSQFIFTQYCTSICYTDVFTFLLGGFLMCLLLFIFISIFQAILKQWKQWCTERKEKFNQSKDVVSLIFTVFPHHPNLS